MIDIQNEKKEERKSYWENTEIQCYCVLFVSIIGYLCIAHTIMGLPRNWIIFAIICLWINAGKCFHWNFPFVSRWKYTPWANERSVRRRVHQLVHNSILNCMLACFVAVALAVLILTTCMVWLANIIIIQSVFFSSNHLGISEIADFVGTEKRRIRFQIGQKSFALAIIQFHHYLHTRREGERERNSTQTNPNLSYTVHVNVAPNAFPRTYFCSVCVCFSS